MWLPAVEDAPATTPPTVVELLPWGYPNLTFYVALAALGVRHLFWIVDGAAAYSSMRVDAPVLVEALARELTPGPGSEASL